jgi:hypothetical protein
LGKWTSNEGNSINSGGKAGYMEEVDAYLYW